MLLGEEAIEFSSWAILEDEEKFGFILEWVMEFNDKGVINLD